MILRGIGASGIVAALMLSDRSGHGQCSYEVDVYAAPACSILPSWAGNSRAINDAGDMCLQYVDCGEVGHSIIWHADGTVAELPLARNGGIPTAYGLNSYGEAVGPLNVPGPLPRAFHYSNGVTTELGMLPGDISAEAFGIAINGRIAGYSTGCNPTCRYHAVLWQDGAIEGLELPMGPKSIAYDVSESGLFICGWMGQYPSTHFGGSHAFIWQDGVAIDLGTPDPPTAATEARAVNNLGQACGIVNHAQKFPSGYSRGFLWSNGKLEDIGVLPGYTQCMAFDLNDSAQIVGQCTFDNGSGEPFVWHDGSMHALDDLIPADLNLQMISAWAINNAGQIAGDAIRPGPNGYDTLAVRLTPVPKTPGDFNCNKVVDVDDLLGVINSWGIEGTTTADFNQDKIVDVEDLVIVIDNWTM